MASIRLASLAAVLLSLSGCAVYEPYPTYSYPSYYGPAVVAPPVYGPTIVYREGYRGYPHRHGWDRNYGGWGHGGRRHGGWHGHHGR